MMLSREIPPHYIPARKPGRCECKPMNLFFFRMPGGNFGDDQNLWLWDEVMPGWRDVLPDHLLVGIGTLINNLLPRGMPKLIMGSGVGYGERIDEALKAECHFVAVRGPRSAARLGLPATVAAVDPAVLLPGLPAFQGIPRAGRPIFVPHASSVPLLDWASLCERAGVDYVSPQGEAHAVVRRIAGAPLVIAESMHAAIIADAFRVPWHAISMTPEFNDFKWMDWAESLEIPLHIHGRPWERLTGARPPTSAEGAPAALRIAQAEGGANRIRAQMRRLMTPLRNAAKERIIARRFAEFVQEPGQLSRADVLLARQADLRQRCLSVLEMAG